MQGENRWWPRGACASVSCSCSKTDFTHPWRHSLPLSLDAASEDLFLSWVLQVVTTSQSDLTHEIKPLWYPISQPLAVWRLRGPWALPRSRPNASSPRRAGHFLTARLLGSLVFLSCFTGLELLGQKSEQCPYLRLDKWTLTVCQSLLKIRSNYPQSFCLGMCRVYSNYNTNGTPEGWAVHSLYHCPLRPSWSLPQAAHSLVGVMISK